MSDNDPPSYLLGFALFWAMIMCGSAGVVFSALTNNLHVPPALCTSWRLIWVEILQIIPFTATVRRLQEEYEERTIVKHWITEGTALIQEGKTDTADEEEGLDNPTLLSRFVTSIPLLMLSGVCLGVHFTSWVYSLRMTSLTHSLLWVSMGPILINGGCWIVYLVRLTKVRPSLMETFGTLVGLSGALIMLLDVGKGTKSGAGYHPPTLSGDMTALLGAATVSVYLVIGRHLRAWMPLWIYTFAVIGVAYSTSLLLSFLLGENPSVSMVFGFVQHPYLPYALYLGAGPGLGGHVMLNFLVKFVSPLTIATAMLSEPLLGSVIGFFAGMQGIPQVYTWLGGVVLLIGLYLILRGEQQRSELSQDNAT